MKKNNSFSLEKLFWQITTLVALGALFFTPLTSAVWKLGMSYGIELPVMISPVKALELYPMFTCPCDDMPLEKGNPCCSMASEMIDFIDKQIASKASRKQVILATVKEFGIERLADENQRIAIKQQLLDSVPQDAPKIVVKQVRKDLGIVDRKNGVVTTEFVIKNEGNSDLVINKLKSSCNCTSGAVVYQGVEGPRFYMKGHGFKEPDPNWSVTIKPQTEAKVKVYYDPMVHPDLVGAVTRIISVYSNDPINFETKLSIVLEQI